MNNFSRALKQLVRGAHGYKNKQRIIINDVVFSQLQLLRGTGHTPLNKAGRMIWKAYMDDIPVKIYECDNERHANFIQNFSEQHKDIFPKCFMRIGTYLIVEWVNGIPISKVKDKNSMLDKLTKIQSQLHSTILSNGMNEACFDYLDYLLKRARRYKSFLPIDDELENLISIANFDKTKKTLSISHPDLTLDNLVLEEETGKLKIIDNELLTINNYYMIDIFNTIKGFKGDGDLVEQYLNSYVNQGGNLNILKINWEAFVAVWNLRIIASALQAGRIDDVMNVLNHNSSNNAMYHDEILNKVKSYIDKYLG